MTTLREEATELEGAGREYVLHITAVLTLILAALGVGGSLGISGDQPEVILVLPFIIIGLLIYMLQLLTESEARRGIRRAIEAALDEGGTSILISGRILHTAVPTQRGSVNRSTLLFGTAVIVATFAALGVSIDYFFFSPERDTLLWRVIGASYLIVLFPPIAPLIAAANESITMGEKAYQLAAERLGLAAGGLSESASPI